MHSLSHSFHESEVRVQISIMLCSGSHGAVIKVPTGLHFPLRKKPASKLIQVIGRIHFLALQDGGPHFLADCWLKATLSP